MKQGAFWKRKKAEDFSSEEWESICTRCGKCCQIKLQDEEGGDVFYTDIVCRYFNQENCSCSCYDDRCKLVPSCLKLTSENWDKIEWIPRDCAYYILQQTGDLPKWHPLVSGRPLPEAYSVKGKVISETLVSEEDWEDHIIEDEND